MANLVLNGKSIDNIDDIAENFVEADVLREFQSGSLTAWLDEYGYEDELARVREIKPTASSIRILSGIIDALNLDDEVIARANAHREEQQRKEDDLRKAREEKLRKEEEERQCREREELQRKKEQADKSFYECLCNIKNSSNIITAQNAIRNIMKLHSDRIFTDSLIKDSKGASTMSPLVFFIPGAEYNNIFVWCALFGCQNLRLFLSGYDLIIRKSPSLYGTYIRVKRGRDIICGCHVSELQINSNLDAVNLAEYCDHSVYACESLKAFANSISWEL